MKCTLLYEKEVMPTGAPVALLAQCIHRDGHTFAPVGTLIDDPDCWMIVLMGQAEPADDECREKSGQTPEKRAAALHAARRLAHAIDPEDYAKFDAGIIAGYNADGSYKPGPNWVPQSLDDEDEDE